MIDRTLIRFLIVGIGNTILGLGVIFGARQIFSDIVANLIGYLVVVPISFLSHRDLSFKDGEAAGPHSSATSPPYASAMQPTLKCSIPACRPEQIRTSRRPSPSVATLL